MGSGQQHQPRQLGRPPQALKGQIQPFGRRGLLLQDLHAADATAPARRQGPPGQGEHGEGAAGHPQRQQGVEEAGHPQLPLALQQEAQGGKSLDRQDHQAQRQAAGQQGEQQLGAQGDGGLGYPGRQQPAVPARVSAAAPRFAPIAQGGGPGPSG